MLPPARAKKQVTAVLAEGDLDSLFGGLQKSLRYGSVLYLKDGLKMVYNKESRVLKCTASCTMHLAKQKSSCLILQLKVYYSIVYTHRLSKYLKVAEI
jgi:hypothetical protein